MDKYRLLRKSLEFRCSEFPNLKETNDNQPNSPASVIGVSSPPSKSTPKMPKLIAITGTLTIKLLGAEGLLDFHSISEEKPELDVSLSSDKSVYSSRTLPGRGSKEVSNSFSPVTTGTGSGAVFIRRGSTHSKTTSSLQNRHSGEIVEDMTAGRNMGFVLLGKVAIYGQLCCL